MSEVVTIDPSKDLTAEEQDLIRANAKVRGVSVPVLLRQLVLRPPQSPEPIPFHATSVPAEPAA